MHPSHDSPNHFPSLLIPLHKNCLYPLISPIPSRSLPPSKFLREERVDSPIDINDPRIRAPTGQEPEQSLTQIQLVHPARWTRINHRRLSRLPLTVIGVAAAARVGYAHALAAVCGDVEFG